MKELILITGFLGSGKTTVIKELLTQFSDKKIGLIVNEFGTINIDSEILSTQGNVLQELSNGSIFCSCLKDKFLESLIEVSKRDVNTVFIEASGMADPANMNTIVQTINKLCLEPYYYRGSLSIVDGMFFSKLSKVLISLRNQILYASAVIINKIDLIDNSMISEIENIIAEINPETTIYKTSFGNIDYKDVISSMVPVELNGISSNTVDNRLKSFVLKSQELINLEDFKEFMSKIANKTYRVKGFVITNEGIIEVQGVNEQIVYNKWPNEIDESHIVIISSVGINLISDILALNNELLHKAFIIK